MSPPIIAVVRQAYRAFAERELPTLRRLAHPDVEVRTVTGMLAARQEPYRGHEGLEAYLDDVARVWDELELHPAEFHPLDSERVLVLGRVLARRGSALHDSPSAWVWTVREGLVVAVEVYGDAEAALELLGRPES